MLVNHAAHILWVGSTLADLVVNCRGSALENIWTRDYRHARAGVVPIPLLEPTTIDSNHVGREAHWATKQKFGLPANSHTLLTVGATFKYERTQRLDFVTAVEGILSQVPDAHLLAVGVMPDERWSSASTRVGGRIHATGPISQARLAEAHSIADVYIEGFPFGTTTAVLEAGLRGVPVVLAPSESPPPYGSDGIALDATLTRPCSVSTFQRMVIALLSDPTERLRQGRILSMSLRKHHTGDGWRRHLLVALRSLPKEHEVSAPVAAQQIHRDAYEYWANFVDPAAHHSPRRWSMPLFGHDFTASARQ